MSEARYQVTELIAAGGMAEVYRGESAGIEGFRKKVAIKKVLPKLSANREFINMFLDEARLCAYLSHSKCVQVFDIGQAAGSHFIVMEYVDGADLKGVLDYLSTQSLLLPVEVCVAIAMDVCEGLHYAHHATDHRGDPLHLVHRDVSPQNVLMTRFGEVKVVDFGLAKASSHLTDEDEDMVKGKFGYLAPEITMGKRPDKRVDVFATGILLWEMLCGRRLFLGESDLDTFKLVRAAKIPDPRSYRDDISDELVGVLIKALARNPDERYQSSAEFANDLAIVLMQAGKPVTFTAIAHFVEETAKAREAKRKKEKPNTEGLIGDLLLDALHDFSILDEDDAHKRARMGTPGVVAESEGSFENPEDWGLGDLLDNVPGEKPTAPARQSAPRNPAPSAPQQAAPQQPPPQQAAGQQAPPQQAPHQAQQQPAQQAPPQPAGEGQDEAHPHRPPDRKEGGFWKRILGS